MPKSLTLHTVLSPHSLSLKTHAHSLPLWLSTLAPLSLASPPTSHILLLQRCHRRRIFEQALVLPSLLRAFNNWGHTLRNIMRGEAFSTYPRSYDLIHANGVFSLYKDKLALSLDEDVSKSS
ncbi:unnamed protein product [Camellia sinensis]